MLLFVGMELNPKRLARALELIKGLGGDLVKLE